MGCRTLSDDDDNPPFGLQLALDLLITFLVPGYLGYPEVAVGLGNRVVLAALMAMLEAAVDEDDGAVFWEDNIRGAWEAFVVQTVTKAETPEDMTQL